MRASSKNHGKLRRSPFQGVTLGGASLLLVACFDPLIEDPGSSMADPVPAPKQPEVGNNDGTTTGSGETNAPAPSNVGETSAPAASTHGQHTSFNECDGASPDIDAGCSEPAPSDKTTDAGFTDHGDDQ